MKQVHGEKLVRRNAAREELPRDNFRRRLRNASFALLVAGAMASGPFMGRARAATPEQEKEWKELVGELIRLKDGRDSGALIAHMEKEKKFAIKIIKTYEEEVERGEFVKAKRSLTLFGWYLQAELGLNNYSRYSDWSGFLQVWNKMWENAHANLRALGYRANVSIGKEEVKKGSWGESLAANHAREVASKEIEPFDILIDGGKWDFRLIHNANGEDTNVRFRVEGKSISLRELDREINRYIFRPESLPPCRPRKLDVQQKNYVRAVIVRELLDKYPDVEVLEK